MKRTLPLWLALIALGAACRFGGSTPLPTTLPSTSTPLAPASPVDALTQTPIETASEAPIETPTNAPVPTMISESAQPLPASPIFEIDWKDSAPYQAGLIASQQKALSRIAAATIYHMAIEISDDYQHIAGRQAVRYINNEDAPLDQILFRLFPNISDGSSQVTNLTLNDEPVEPAYSLQDSVMTVSMPAPLPPGEAAILSMDFEVVVPQSAGGNYGIFAYLEDVLALAHFYPMIAVYDDEGWNAEIPPPSGDVVYADASFYLARVSAPADLVVVGGGSEVSHIEADGRQEITYALGPARDFYLAASSRYELISSQVGETTLNSYTFPEWRARSELSLETMRHALNSFNDRYGAYPYTELDLVSTATLALGIEYPGIIVATNRAYEDNPPRYDPVTLESTVAHEVAHQWFYATIGNDQLDEPWLDESVTQYATMVYFGDRYGDAGTSGFRNSLLQRWGGIGGQEVAIGQPVADFSPAEYNGIVYGRGGLFMEALATEMGEAAFDQFMLNYAGNHQWGIATAESFRAEAETACGCDLESLFADWIYE